MNKAANRKGGTCKVLVYPESLVFLKSPLCTLGNILAPHIQ